LSDSEDRIDDAIECYKKAIKLDNAHVKAHSHLGDLLYNQRRFDEAEEHYLDALKINPDYADAHNNYGNLLSDLKRFDEAERHYLDALKIDPDYAPAHNNYGNLLSDLVRLDEAEKHYLDALRIDPDYADAHYNYGVLLSDLVRFDEALKHFEKASKLFKNEGSVHWEHNSLWWTKNLNKKIKRQKEAKKKKTVLEKIPEQDVVEAVFKELKEKKDAIFDHITNKEKEFNEFISAGRTITPDDNFLIVLRRWNSYTPAMPSQIEKNKGGGYFLSWKGKGIVIDPGFNFVENFIHQGFKITDIDAIMITHAHIDHCIDFEALLPLLHEHNEDKKEDEKHKIDVFMGMGPINKFLGWVTLDNGDIRRVYSLDANDTKRPEGYDFTLKVKEAKHHEVVSDMYCIGLIFELNDVTRKFRLGLTSDTGYTKHIGEQYKGCDMLVAHLGSVKKNEFDPDKDLDDRLYKTHLGLIGITRIIKDANPKLAVISEFGQELEEERVDIVKAINKVLDNRCITGDIGLKIKLPDLKIRCDWCTGKNKRDTYKEIDEIKDVCDPRTDEKKVDYVCEDCLP